MSANPMKAIKAVRSATHSFALIFHLSPLISLTRFSVVFAAFNSHSLRSVSLKNNKNKVSPFAAVWGVKVCLFVLMANAMKPFIPPLSQFSFTLNACRT